MMVKVSRSYAAMFLAALLVNHHAFTPTPIHRRGAAAGRWSERRGPGSIVSSRTTKLFSASIEPKFQVSIEYCPGCRWNLRSFWLVQELLTTFVDEPSLEAVTVIPSRSEQGGRFTVTCSGSGESDDNEAPISDQVLWDRKENGGFPESKDLKQLVRDQIAPTRYLGHSDTTQRKEEKSDSTVLLPLDPKTVDMSNKLEQVKVIHSVEPNVMITYCTGCKWLLRAAYFAQELLSTFETEINSMTLVPSRPPAKGGVFTIHIDGDVVWDRSAQGRFPEVPEIKQLVRDVLNPTKNLGHSDNRPPIEAMGDDDAEDARKFFGVL